MNRVVLIEFNELSPTLLDQFMAEGKLPNFKKFYDDSQVYVTEAEEKLAPNLEPWIQWYSLHTGVPFKEHGVFHLTDGPRASQVDIWHHVLNAGKSVLNCSSMNAKSIIHDRAVFLPDPWCTSEPPHPPELNIFHQFVARQVQEYSNADKPMRISAAVKFLQFMVSHGLSIRTVWSIIYQIGSELVSAGKSSWRRVTILDKLLADIFGHYYHKLKPDFATFFVNSTAHLQHSYWRCMEPEAFALKPSTLDIQNHGDSILFGYQEMDQLLGDFFRIEQRSKATLVLATALSQQPFTKYDDTGGQNFYRPRRVEEMLKIFGVRYLKIDPVMTHQYLIHFESVADSDNANKILSGVKLGEKPIFEVRRPAEPASLYFGCQIKNMVDKTATYEMSANESGKNMFFETFYRIDEIKSGRHHPDGCFWIKTGKHARIEQKVSILDILPTLLGILDIKAPNLVGKKLLDLPAT